MTKVDYDYLLNQLYKIDMDSREDLINFAKSCYDRGAKTTYACIFDYLAHCCRFKESSVKDRLFLDYNE